MDVVNKTSVRQNLVTETRNRVRWSCNWEGQFSILDTVLGRRILNSVHHVTLKIVTQIISDIHLLTKTPKIIQNSKMPYFSPMTRLSWDLILKEKHISDW